MLVLGWGFCGDCLWILELSRYPVMGSGGVQQRMGMKNIRVDNNGIPKCWNCGSKGFTEKRPFRPKAMVGVGAVPTKKR